MSNFYSRLGEHASGRRGEGPTGGAHHSLSNRAASRSLASSSPACSVPQPLPPGQECPRSPQSPSLQGGIPGPTRGSPSHTSRQALLLLPKHNLLTPQSGGILMGSALLRKRALQGPSFREFRVLEA